MTVIFPISTHDRSLQQLSKSTGLVGYRKRCESKKKIIHQFMPSFQLWLLYYGTTQQKFCYRTVFKVRSYPKTIVSLSHLRLDYSFPSKSPSTAEQPATGFYFIINLNQLLLNWSALSSICINSPESGAEVFLFSCTLLHTIVYPLTWYSFKIFNEIVRPGTPLISGRNENRPDFFL